ncbi:hypothetical protein [Paraburkholderia sp. DHOC27]|uniref:hypothetical protein n=1 Tax=Paraburkholderia sp. DHOC27 TaxID=2303330 RepID=UPI000E3CD857|nr:hypothetical protein [Paraburkholderia sp. DHOC27]RFU45452.1 hypothetical protein D0B32_22840 [Paraburkholderia sp. DHOC27]
MTTLLTVSLIEENGQISINYENGDPTSLVKPETIEQLIEVLAQMRASMAPARVPVEPQAGQPMQAVPDPRWYVGNALNTPHAFVSLHHPGFGWTPYALPLVSAKAFHEQLAHAIAAIEEQPGEE